jgi:hypothetical protein
MGMEWIGMEWIGLDSFTFFFHEIKRLEPLQLNKKQKNNIQSAFTFD